MKKFTLVLIALLVTSTISFAQQSDYQTVVDFQVEIEKFKHQIDNAITSNQLENISLEIDEFRQFYLESEEIINRGIYPNVFETEIAGLVSSLITNENRLVMIEHQREQLFEMSNRITSQRSEINRLYVITDSLKKEILTSQASEARLSDLISNYRQRIEQRDKLVFEMIDSLLITHDNIVFQNLNEGEAQSFPISDSQNPLNWIQTVLDENTDYSRYQNRLLAVEDYIRLYALQQHFESVWNKVGDDFITVYGGDEKTIIAHSIESSIRSWRIASTQRMWSAIDLHLDLNEIELASFDNKESFFWVS